MTNKLIEWATVPIGIAVTQENLMLPKVGWLASMPHPFNKSICVLSLDKVTCDSYLIKHLRLAPAEQQPWLVYEEGVTVIPEWAEFSFKVKDYKRKILGHPQIDADLYTESFTDRTVSDNTVYLTGQAFAYKIIGVKTGWTDNLNEVTE